MDTRLAHAAPDVSMPGVVFGCFGKYVEALFVHPSLYVCRMGDIVLLCPKPAVFNLALFRRVLDSRHVVMFSLEMSRVHLCNFLKFSLRSVACKANIACGERVSAFSLRFSSVKKSMFMFFWLV